MARISLLSIIVFLWVFPCCRAHAQEFDLAPMVEASGTVKVPDANWARGRKRALTAAMRQAVTTQLTRMLDARGKTFDSYRGPLKKILENSSAYVQSYQVLDETRDEEAKTLTIRLNTGLFNRELAEALYRTGAIRLRQGHAMTRVVLLIGEKNLEEDGRLLPFDEFEPISEAVLTQILSNNKMEVLDRYFVSQASSAFYPERAVKGDIKAAIAVGVQCGVDAVIMGTSISRALPPNPRKPGLNSVRVNVSLRLIRVDKGAVVGARSEFATGFGIDQEESERDAFKKAFAKLGDFFVRQIQNLWKDE